ncbi:hypothetical protein ACFQV8_30860 [Pseudonocardia benzenivorans]
MTPYLLFLFLGLSLGAVYASMALSITLTYQGSGVINFAAGAMATVPLYVYDDLRNGLFSLPCRACPRWRSVSSRCGWRSCWASPSPPCWACWSRC